MKGWRAFMVWNTIKTILIIGIVAFGLSFITRSIFDNEGEYTIQTKNVSHKLETRAMDKLTAEDLSLSTQLFLKQLSVQMERWANRDFNNQQLRVQFVEELKEHPHFNGFAIVKNGKLTEQAGTITRLNPSKLTHRHMNSKFSDPYSADGKQYMLLGETLKDGRTVLGEVDLSFVKTFVKDIASVADSTGTFFVSSDDPSIKWKTTEDMPENIYAHTVPELGWQIAVHSKDDQDKEIDRAYHEHQAVIKFKQPDLADAWFQEHSELKVVDHHGPLLVVESKQETAEELIRRLRADQQLTIVEPNYIFSNQLLTKAIKHQVKINEQTPVEPNDEFFQPYQWNLKQIDAGEGWNLANGKDVTIAILDTGIDPAHLDLKDKILKGYNVTTDTDDVSDKHGHGTHVAGIAAALTNNVTGIAGVSWKSNILPVKVLNEAGEGTSYEVAKGIYWAVDHGADVINMSLGDYNHSDILYDAVKYAYDHNVVLVSASGNDNVEEPMYPSKYDEVLAVAAVDESRNRAFFSNYGQHVDISAPGEHIPSSYPNNNYIVMSGTSMASPHVAGLAALIRSLRPDLSNNEVYKVIAETAKDLGTKGHDPYYGFGEIDIAKSLEAIIK